MTYQGFFSKISCKTIGGLKQHHDEVIDMLSFTLKNSLKDS